MDLAAADRSVLARQTKMHQKQLIPIPKNTTWPLEQWAAFSLRYVTAWSGPRARVTSCALRLGAPAYPGDTLAFTGAVTADEVVEGSRRVSVDVVGSVSLGAHVTATVVLDMGEQT